MRISIFLACMMRELTRSFLVAKTAELQSCITMTRQHARILTFKFLWRGSFVSSGFSYRDIRIQLFEVGARDEIVDTARHYG